MKNGFADGEVYGLLVKATDNSVLVSKTSAAVTYTVRAAHPANKRVSRSKSSRAFVRANQPVSSPPHACEPSARSPNR